ncbi:hypothetical protein BST61_g7997 [Cercospora zeina]
MEREDRTGDACDYYLSSTSPRFYSVGWRLTEAFIIPCLRPYGHFLFFLSRLLAGLKCPRYVLCGTDG